MAVSVVKFIEENRAVLEGCYGYATLCKEAARIKGKVLRISNDMIAKKLLANGYGHPCEERMCHLFKAYARKHTEFILEEE